METKNEELQFLKGVIIVVILGFLAYSIFHNQSGNSTQKETIQPIISDTQNSQNDTTKIVPATELSNSEMCKQFAQKESDSDGQASNLYYSVQSYHYSNQDNACYYELHYQMDFNFQGNIDISQVYLLKALSKDNMVNSLKYNFPSLGSQEANCIVPEITSISSKINCKYYGLESVVYTDGNAYIVQKIPINNEDIPSMSYPDYKTLVQKRMSN